MNLFLPCKNTSRQSQRPSHVNGVQHFQLHVLDQSQQNSPREECNKVSIGLMMRNSKDKYLKDLQHVEQ